VKKHILVDRIARLKGHIESVGESDGFRRALAKAEAELQALDEQRKDDQPRGA
jgi:hypothetical protein